MTPEKARAALRMTQVIPIQVIDIKHKPLPKSITDPKKS